MRMGDQPKRKSGTLLRTGIIAAALLAVLTGVKFPGLVWKSTEEVDIRGGRIRESRFVVGIAVSRQVRDSEFTRVLGAGGEVADWRLVRTVEGKTELAAAHLYRGATSQIERMAIFWKEHQVGPEGRQEMTRTVLQLWQKGGNSFGAGQYIMDLEGGARDAEYQRAATRAAATQPGKN